MSCDTGVAAGPAGCSGISALANKAAHFAGKATGVAGGAAAGAIIGGGLGTLTGPAGTIAGAVAGGVAGGVLGNKRYEKRQAKLQEKQWREGVAGKKALVQFDQTSRKLKLAYKEKNDKFKVQKENIENELEQAKETWIKEMPKETNKQLAKNAAGVGILAGGATMAVELAADKKLIVPGVAYVGLATALAYSNESVRGVQKAWKQSPEGK